MSSGTGFRKPCLECGLPGDPGEPRCKAHTRVYERIRSVKASARRGPTPRAQALRRALSQESFSVCVSCRVEYPVHNLEVDHIDALADGGVDADYNLQILCRSCHTSKTLEENRRRKRI